MRTAQRACQTRESRRISSHPQGMKAMSRWWSAVPPPEAEFKGTSCSSVGGRVWRLCGRPRSPTWTRPEQGHAQSLLTLPPETLMVQPSP